MADEIADANVVHIWQNASTGRWHALLGPARGGLVIEAANPSSALVLIAVRASSCLWAFDPSAASPRGLESR